MDNGRSSAALFAEKIRKSAELEAWREIKKWIESANMNLCGDPRTAKDINAAIQLFKSVLVRRADDRISKIQS